MTIRCAVCYERGLPRTGVQPPAFAYVFREADGSLAAMRLFRLPQPDCDQGDVTPLTRAAEEVIFGGLRLRCAVCGRPPSDLSRRRMFDLHDQAEHGGQRVAFA